MSVDAGNEAQMRIFLDQVAESAATNVMLKLRADQLSHPTPPAEAVLHPLVKWLVGAIAALGSVALTGLGVWLVTSVSSMSNTLARMDERMKGADTVQIARDAAQDDKIRRLEAYHLGSVK